MKTIIAIGLLCVSMAVPAQNIDARFAQYFDELLTLYPILATHIGEDAYNDRATNPYSEAFANRLREFHNRWLRNISAIDPATLNPQQRLSREIFLYNQRDSLAGLDFPSHLIPIEQFDNYANQVAQLGSGEGAQPFASVKDYERWLSRLRQMLIVFDQAITNMRTGMKQGIVQPAVLMHKVLPQLSAHMVDDPTQSLFFSPIENFPAHFTTSQRQQLTQEYRDVIAYEVVPAYQRLHTFIAEEYLPACRDSVGLSQQLGGEPWYQWLIRSNTTVDWSAERIHQFGLAEVDRIRSAMNRVKEQVGFEGTLSAFFEHLKTDDAYYFDSADALLRAYREQQAAIAAALPQLFDIQPKAEFVVKPVPAFRAQSAAGASYEAGTADGSRGGIFYINTYNLKAQPKFLLETLSIHEAAPGHHFQVSLQQEIPDLPRFRRYGGYVAFEEGWALYAESLGQELGLFTDPYQWYGRLSDEMLRAMRLVVDTGLHAKGWSREKAIAYMQENSSMAQSDIVAEVERYIAIPGQALGYKVGEKIIRDLRTEAEQALGRRFDVRAFHRQVLADGAMPMTILQQKIRAWIAAQKTTVSAG